MTIETHPLEPFLPTNGRMLFLGSFPPPQARWSMEFFYPNFINDFWRIMGIIFYQDKNHFVVADAKRFDKGLIVAFAQEQGLGFFDTASKVNRLKDNASDNFLEIIEPTDICELLQKMPDCHRIVTTGQKASEQVMKQVGIAQLPEIGSCVPCHAFGRELEFWRMPSSSRAYPLAIDKKANFYRRLFE